MNKAYFVTEVTLDSGETVGIYRTDGGVLFGIDACYLQAMDDEDTVTDPYGDGELQLVE